MTARARMADDSPLKSEQASLSEEAIEFDLSSEGKEEGTSKKKTYGPPIIGYSAIGVFVGGLGVYYLFFVDHSLSDRLQDVAWIVAGVAIILGGTYVVRMLGTNEVVRLRIDASTLAFMRQNGKSQVWSWSDPRFKVNIYHLGASPEGILPQYDARRARPDWVEAFNPPSRMIRLETTTPRRAADRIIGEARRRGLAVRTIRASFFWGGGGPHTPGSLQHEIEGHLTKNHALNGEITQLRPPTIAWNRSD